MADGRRVPRGLLAAAARWLDNPAWHAGYCRQLEALLARTGAAGAAADAGAAGPLAVPPARLLEAVRFEMVQKLASLAFNDAIQAQLSGREQQAAQLWAQAAINARRAQELCPQDPQPAQVLSGMHVQQGDIASGVAVLRGSLQAAQAAGTDYGTALVAFGLAALLLSKASGEVAVAAFAGQDARGVQVRMAARRSGVCQP